MSGTRVLIDLAGQVGLLLWGTHMVSTGVQRGFGTALRRSLERNLGRRPWAFLTGIGVTPVLRLTQTAAASVFEGTPATQVARLAEEKPAAQPPHKL